MVNEAFRRGASAAATVTPEVSPSSRSPLLKTPLACLYTPVIFPFACPTESWITSPSASSKLQWATGVAVCADTLHAKRRTASKHARTGANSALLHDNALEM